MRQSPATLPWVAELPPTHNDGDDVLALVSDDAFAAGRRVRVPLPLAALESQHPVSVTVRYGRVDGRVLVSRLLVSPHVAGEAVGRAPDLAYVVHPEPDREPPGMNLVAFPAVAGDGEVLTVQEATDRGWGVPDQVAGIRWLLRSGTIHMVVVAPGWRRRRIGTKLLAAAAGLCAVHGWPDLRGSGDRTDLGQAMSDALPRAWQTRIPPRTGDGRPSGARPT